MASASRLCPKVTKTFEVLCLLLILFVRKLKIYKDGEKDFMRLDRQEGDTDLLGSRQINELQIDISESHYHHNKRG